MGALILPFAEQSPCEPTDTQVVHFHLNGDHATAITRHWADCSRVTCGGLCAEKDCTFNDGVCQIGVIGHVPTELCPAFANRPAT